LKRQGCLLLSLLEVDFLVGLDDYEALASEFHLDALAAAAAEEGLQGYVLFESGLQVPRPGNGCVGVGGDGEVGCYSQGDRIVVCGDGHHARAFQADVEEAAGQHGRDLFHHFDLVLNAHLECEDVVAIYDDGIVIEIEDGYLLAGVGQVEDTVAFGLGETGSFTADHLLEEVASTLAEDAFAGKLDVADVGDHGAHLGPDGAIQVDLKHARGFEFEEAFAAVLVFGFFDEAVYGVFIHDLGKGELVGNKKGQPLKLPRKESGLTPEANTGLRRLF